MHQLIEELRSIAYPEEPPYIWIFKAITLALVIIFLIAIYVVIVGIIHEYYKLRTRTVIGRLV